MSSSVAMVIPIGPGKDTAERRESLRRASVQEVRSKVADVSRVSVKTWIYIGKELAGVKRAAEKDPPGTFAAMFSRNADDRIDPAKYPFSYSQARQLIYIAEKFVSTANTEQLPASWPTLYALSQIEPRRLQKLIASGGVHPMMTRAEAQRLANATSKKRTPKRRAGFASAKKLFLRIESPEKRAKRFLAFMRECGLTLEQLEEIAQ